MTWLDELAQKSLARERPARAEALRVLASDDDELMDVVAAAFKVRLRYFGRRVKLNYLVNIKSGLSPEDCFYCSQRLGSAADVLKYTWLKPGEVLDSAEAGVKAGAKRVCLVASGRGPNDADITRVSAAIAAFKARNPDIEVCACLGLLKQARPSACTRPAPPPTTTTSTPRKATTRTSAPRTPTRLGRRRYGKQKQPAFRRARA